MEKIFTPSCVRCPLKDTFEAWADRCESIENEAAKNPELQLAFEGYLKCKGFIEYGVTETIPSGACKVEYSSPLINRIYAEAGDVKLTAPLCVSPPPSLEMTRLTPNE